MVAGKAKLELREAMLKFRGPEKGYSEGLLRVESFWARDCWEAMVSILGGKTAESEEAET
jgi:hypothetical protein